ncbi:MAG: PIN domain-containing protein [Thermodesulfobacteriota bacterium]
MAKRIKVFLDTSALFSGIWSSTGGSRLILKLGEAELIELIISSQVLTEIENVIKRKAPNLLGNFVLLIDRSNIQIIPDIKESILPKLSDLIDNKGDEIIISTALNIKPDYFVTLDKSDFLENRELQKAINFLIATPGDFIKLWKENLFSK